jgi:DNA-binding response OmpR family regulator
MRDLFFVYCIQYEFFIMKILLVEDDAELRKVILSFLNSEKYLCETASTYQEAMDKVGV